MYAYFSSEEISTDNVFTTGTLDLGISPASGFITADNLEPGGSVTASLTVTNDGTLDLKYKCTTGHQAGSAALYNALTAEVTRTTTIRYWETGGDPGFRVDISITADGTHVIVRARAVDPLPSWVTTLSLDQSLNIYIDANHNGVIDVSDIYVSVINDRYLRPGTGLGGWQDEGTVGTTQPLGSIGIVVTKTAGDITVKIPYPEIGVADMAIIGMRFQAFGYTVLPLPAWVAWLDVTLFHYDGLLNAIPTTRVGEIMSTSDRGYLQWDTLAFEIGLSSGAGNTLQGKSTTVKFTFDATQVENPSW